MIIFINGSFGVGKSTVAERLVKRLPGARLFDPEQVGFVLQKVLGPLDPRDDFQHYPAWRKLTIKTAWVLQLSGQRTLVVPMTIWREAYWHEVVGGLRELDSDFHHFTLTVPLEVIQRRLLRRGGKEGCWTWQQAELCVPALADPMFAQHLDATYPPDALVEQIVAIVKPDLAK